jgi:hypothetical protein
VLEGGAGDFLGLEKGGAGRKIKVLRRSLPEAFQSFNASSLNMPSSHTGHSNNTFIASVNKVYLSLFSHHYYYYYHYYSVALLEESYRRGGFM